MNRYVSLDRSPQQTDDADGYFEPLSPANAWCAIEPQQPIDDGRTVLQLITMRFHPQVTMDTRITYDDQVVGRVRQFFVRGFQNLGDANTEMRLIAEEVIP